MQTVWNSRALEAAQQKAAHLFRSEDGTSASMDFAGQDPTCMSQLSPIESIRANCQLYSQRPALGYRAFHSRSDDAVEYEPEFTTITFAQFWSQVVATASGLKRSAFLEGAAVMGICGFADVDAVVGEFAALYLGIPCIHLDASWSAAELEWILGHAGITCLICSADSLERLAEALPHSPRLQTLLIKSIDFRDIPSAQECARIKAMISRQNRRLLVTSLKVIQDLGQDLAPVACSLPDMKQDPLVTMIYEPACKAGPRVSEYYASDWADFFGSLTIDGHAKLPFIALHHLPLSQIEGRAMVLRGLLLGGVSYFTTRRDLSMLAGEMRWIRPTHLAVDDRLEGLLKERFDRELLALTAHAAVPLSASTREELVLEAMRTDPMGERLLVATTFTPEADSAADSFVQQCLSVPVVEKARFKPRHDLT